MMRKVRNIKWGVPITFFLGLGFLFMMTGAGVGKTEEGTVMGTAGGPMKVTIEGKNIGLGWLSKMGTGHRDGGQHRWHMKGNGYGTVEPEDGSYAKIRITQIAQSMPLDGNTCGEDEGCGKDGDSGKDGSSGKDGQSAKPQLSGDMDIFHRDSGMGEPARGQEHNALRVSRVLDENGKEMMGMEGWILFYLETDKSKPLIGGHRGNWLQVTGSLFAKERIIDVDSFKQSSVAYRPMVRMTLEGKNTNLCQMLKQEGATGSCERYPQAVLQITRVITVEPMRRAEAMEGAEEESEESPQEKAREKDQGERDRVGQTVGVPDMTGWVLHYARTAKAAELFSGHQDHTVQVTGIVLPYKRLMIVETVKPMAGLEEKK
jgi:hypothetical protein